MKLLRYLLLLPALVLAASCSKKEDTPGPSKTSLLTGATWHSTDLRLTINGVEGVYTPATKDTDDIKFGTDGKYTDTPADGGAVGTGAWALASSESQLVLTPTGQVAQDPAKLYALTSTDLTIGTDYTQAQVQHAIDNNNTSPTSTDKTIAGLLFASGAFTFPGNKSPVTSATQITSMGFRANYKAK